VAHCTNRDHERFWDVFGCEGGCLACQCEQLGAENRELREANRKLIELAEWLDTNMDWRDTYYCDPPLPELIDVTDWANPTIKLDLVRVVKQPAEEGTNRANDS
jgi:hypothetical protein